MNDPETGERAALLPHQSPAQSPRVHYLDNLRTSLVALVILHHVAERFGATSYERHSPLALWAFVVINYSYFMGVLFAIAGHFSALAAAKKTRRAFILDKLKRLGIPALVSTLLIQPLAIVLLHRADPSTLPHMLLNYFKYLRGAPGPYWFIATLLFFDLTYITTRTWLPSIPFLPPTSKKRFRITAAVWISLTTAFAFLVRLFFPFDMVLRPLNILLAFTPQWVLAYIAGTSLSALHPYLPTSHPLPSLALAYSTSIGSLLAMVRILGSNYAFFEPGITHPGALFYIPWNEISFYFIGTSLYAVFHTSQFTTRRWGNTARYAYGAYLVHLPLVLALQILVDRSVGEALSEVGQALAVGAFGIVLSWTASWGLIRLPGVQRVI
ncbi:acyltransferase 3 [Mycena rebaudengoi]|nr:acyltransferase 3 [Mycena rebaudengoi]